MRIQFSLACQKGTIIPINYQSELSNWVFSVLDKAGSELNLHIQKLGFDLGSRDFKLFTYSPLAIYPYEMDQAKQEFRLLGNQVKLTLSFSLDSQFEQQLVHLFRQYPLQLGTCEGKTAQFEVKHWQVLPKIQFRDTMIFKVSSPISISEIEDAPSGTPYPLPESEVYDIAFFTHLVRKYKNANPTKSLNADNLLDPSFPMQFSLRAQPKSRLIHLKPNAEGLQQVRGFVYEFEISMPQSLMEFAYFSGFGEHGHMGFGFVEIPESQIKRPIGPVSIRS
jgi:CRISPR-associated endoribonuclease Cas6